ncbi:MAG: hypothetical protein V1743_08480 [Nanoarchaeota archaeon]
MNESEYFYCRNGKVAKDLEELADIIQDMSDDEFSHHANEFKNDFSNWILHVLKNADLSEKVRKCTAKEEILLILNEEIMRKNISEKFEAFKEMNNKDDKHELLNYDDTLVESTGLDTDKSIPKDEEDHQLTNIWLGGGKPLLKPVEMQPAHEAPKLPSAELRQHSQEQARVLAFSNPKTGNPENTDLKKEENPAGKEEKTTMEGQKENALLKAQPKEFTLKEFIFGIFLGFVLGFVIAKILFGMVLK